MAIKHFFCGLFRGHDFHLKSTPGEVFIACSHCWKRSPGWQVEAPRTARLVAQRAIKAPTAQAAAKSPLQFQVKKLRRKRGIRG